jgi:signal transduction histidine kinase
MQVNEALVAKIFQYERSEEVLRISEQKQHELLVHEFSTREEERKRMSRAIHDSIEQNLLVLRMDISALHRHTTDKHQRLHERVEAALDNLDEALRAVRQLIADLRPFHLELGLLAAIEWELSKFLRASGIVVEFIGGESIADRSMPDEQVLTVYRVLQECLNNVFRHSLASRCTVSVDVTDNAMSMTISDNGIGIDPDKPRKSSSYGLLSISERVSALGGSLAVTSSRSHGTTIALSLPFTQASS